MSDLPVRTRVLAHGRWWPFQEFMIKARGEGPVDDVDFRGARAAAPTPEVVEAIASAQAIVIGPSNPIISIGPILAVDGLQRAIRDSPAPVVAVSPLVHNQVVKGPTKPFMEWAGQPLSSDGIADCYDQLLDGLVADERTDRVPVLETDVLLADPESRRRAGARTRSGSRSRSGSVWPPMATLAVLPMKTFSEAKRRLRHQLSPGERRALVEAMFSDVLVALRRADSVAADDRGQRRPHAPSRSPPGTGRAWPRTTSGATTGRPRSASGPRSSSALSACCWCPATAPPSARASSTP